mgnify:CR=1 FL=1|tara:strand:- start:911 stop:2422 length:1512 start_codon:yes stop_codon:yes gene_type:complete
MAFVVFTNGYSQEIKEEVAYNQIALKGTVFDAKDQLGLPYVNIVILKYKKGTITNEKGFFSLAFKGLKKTDTIRFQYIGYKSKNISVEQLLRSSDVLLEEDIFNMNEVFVLNKKIDPKDIVKSVLKNREENYKIQPRKEQLFLRRKFIDDLEKLDIECEKSTIEDFDEEMVNIFQEKVPKQTISYDDFLGFVYSKKNEEGKKVIKIDPIKKVKLKSKEIAEMKQFETLFERLIKDTSEKEYWKVKSGVFGKKIDNKHLSEKDSTEVKEKQHKNNDKRETNNIIDLRNSIKQLSTFSTFEDKERWEFLYKTNSYTYNMEGGTSMNGEDVYVIDFVPKKRGLYEGRLYISIKTFALIRADYKFAPSKQGKGFHLLGFSQVHTHFSGSIYFEKKEGNYVLKYFSYKNIETFGLERNFALQKKKNRFLFDKKLQEIKIDLKLKVKSEESIEYLVMDGEKISNNEFDAFIQKKGMKVIAVDQFDKDLWKGYAIIEPTKQMKEYKKISD